MSKLSKLKRGFYRLPIRAEFDPNDPKYIETQSDLFYVDKNGIEIFVGAGYRTDGKSVPKWFWSIVGHPLAPNTLPAAIIHDYLCETELFDSKRVHQIFDEALKDLPKVGFWQRTALVLAVKTFGPRFKAKRITTEDNSGKKK